MTYSQNGSYIAIASVIVMILSKFGIPTDAQTIITVITGAVALFGIIKQYQAHKNLAIQVGAISK